MNKVGARVPAQNALFGVKTTGEGTMAVGTDPALNAMKYMSVTDGIGGNKLEGSMTTGAREQ